MTFYELATLHLTFAGAAGGPAAAVRFASEPEAGGQLLGCWRSEIGPVNKLVLLRSFQSEKELLSERIRTRRSSNPFHCGDALTSMELESYAPIGGFETVTPGRHGAFYEIRSYKVRPGGFARLIPDWEAAGPERSRVSELLLVMYSLDGQDRLTHIWPYDTLDQRMGARVTAARECPSWPPKSGVDCFDSSDMRSGIFIPTPESPLH